MLLQRLAASDTGQATAMVVAVAVSSALSVIFTVVFAPILGATAYASLAALVAAFLILSVPGSALQVWVAREVAAASARGDHQPAAVLAGLLPRLGLLTLVVSVFSFGLRAPIADVVGVRLNWAAAALLPSECLWLVLCAQRGALQGLGRYRVVGLSLMGEAGVRLGLAVVLVVVGLGPTGPFLAIGLAIVLTCAYLARSLGALGAPTSRPRVLRSVAFPAFALSMMALLQNVDVIVVKHQAASDVAGAYAAAAVMAKAIIWVAIGLGLYLLPEATRRTALRIDPRPILLRTLSLILLAAAPMLALYGVAGKPLLGAVFGHGLTRGAPALLWLALAMTLLSLTYLAVQYLLALGSTRPVWWLALAAVLELLLVQQQGSNLVHVAVALVVLNAALAGVLITACLRIVFATLHEG